MIVFLDIDGVLNSAAWTGVRPVHGFIPPSTATEAVEDEWIDPAAVARLRMLIERTDASIVLMSSWRHRMTTVEFKRLLEHYGWTRPPVLGATPDLSGAPRGEEVQAWLEAAGYRPRFLCLDDDADFLPDQPHVQTNPDGGLTDDDMRRCIATLTDTNG